MMSKQAKKNYVEEMKKRLELHDVILEIGSGTSKCAMALKEAGFAIPDYDRTPGGGFFIFARITPELRRALPAERMGPEYTKNAAAPGGEARLDWALCQWMAEEKGVLCIPSSPFFSRERAMDGASDEFIRVAFCKTDETIEQAAKALMGVRSDKQNEVVATQTVTK